MKERLSISVGRDAIDSAVSCDTVLIGAIGGTNASAATKQSDGYTLAAGTGVLVKDAGTTADDGTVKAPVNDWDWSNVADISSYYQIGKLIPAGTGAKKYREAEYTLENELLKEEPLEALEQELLD